MVDISAQEGIAGLSEDKMRVVAQYAKKSVVCCQRSLQGILLRAVRNLCTLPQTAVVEFP